MLQAINHKYPFKEQSVRCWEELCLSDQPLLGPISQHLKNRDQIEITSRSLTVYLIKEQ
jgi:hypothetical protein